MAIPYRTRSHFDGQAVLETGIDKPAGSSDGWLNRLLQVMSGKRAGIAIAAGMPRSLTGPFDVQTWSPTQLGAVDDAYLERLAVLYRTDKTLYGRFEAAVQQQDLVGEEPMAGGNARRGGITPLMQAAARILRAGQRTQRGGRRVQRLGHAREPGHWRAARSTGCSASWPKGSSRSARDMGPAWATTTVVVMTEFGRTARPNGTRGTDHGTAGAGFVIGPSVARSAVIADWPGLGDSALFESRDLKPTLDTRSVLKAAAAGAFDLTAAQPDRVFPGSAAARPLSSLMG